MCSHFNSTSLYFHHILVPPVGASANSPNDSTASLFTTNTHLCRRLTTMASIDRYRPPREGYQPPVAKRRPSRSPARRQDIPPAAPTPPQHSARTSPPKPNDRPQSPAQEDKQAPLALLSQWAFTVDEVSSTPTILDGIPPSEERLRRAKGVNFIYQAGVMLDLPQITLWVAGVYFHRFYMRYSMAQEKNQGGIHHYVG